MNYLAFGHFLYLDFANPQHFANFQRCLYSDFVFLGRLYLDFVYSGHFSVDRFLYLDFVNFEYVFVFRGPVECQ